jgi:hypothetical protein
MNPLSLILMAVGALALLPLVLRWWRQRQARQAWLALAPKLGLSPTEGVERRRVRMGVTVALTPRLHLSRQRPGLRLSERRELKHIQVGDAALDEAVLIRAKNPAAVIRLLREPGVRDALLTFLEGNPGGTVTETAVEAPLGNPVHEEPCQRVLQELARLTSTLGGAARRLALEPTLVERTMLEFLTATFRCPDCEKDIFDEDGLTILAMDVDRWPDVCPHCNARFD